MLGEVAAAFSYRIVGRAVDGQPLRLIRQQDGQFCLIAKDGKKLGCHDTRGEAEAQERAIKASEDKKKTVKLNIKKKDGRFRLIDDDGEELGDFETRAEAEKKAESLMSSEPTEIVLAFEQEDAQ